jgi:hypothetical protein
VSSTKALSRAPAAAVSSPLARSRRRSWVALLLAVLGLLALPAAVDLSRRSQTVSLLDAGYAIPVAFLLGLVALIMARRARDNLRWLSVRDAGTGVASTAVVIAGVTICLAVTAALSIGFYELVLVYQHSR